MNILFINPDFPGRFGYLAEFFAKHSDHTPYFITTQSRGDADLIPGVKKIVVKAKKEKVILKGGPDPSGLALATAEKLVALKSNGFVPDMIIGQSGSPMTFYVKDALPRTLFLCYFEWYHSPENLASSLVTGADRQDEEQDSPQQLKTRMEFRNKNMPILADLAACNLGICPSAWQKEQFPKEFLRKLTLAHSGVDNRFFTPSATAQFKIKGLDLSGIKTLVTYTANILAPYEGFDTFMASLIPLMEKKTDLHVVIVGKDCVAVSHGNKKKKMYGSMVREKIGLDPARVHFIDELHRDDYRCLLQVSDVHIYLDSPLVVSQTLLEAMSCGCLVLTRDTKPLKTIVKDGSNAILADFSDPRKIMDKITACLDYPSFMENVRKKARQTILDHYMLEKMIQKQLNVMKEMIRQNKDESQGPFG